MEELENMKITKRLFEDVDDTQAGVDNIEVEPIDPADKPEQIAVKEFRKHLIWYFKGIKNDYFTIEDGEWHYYQSDLLE